jgi:2-polyprenyl-3-methyl-5-hydroxy-6-metoxy-1,4-benzoquinol methylase
VTSDLLPCACCGGQAFSTALQTDGGPYRACLSCRTLYQEAMLSPTLAHQDKFEEEQDRFYGDDSVMLASGFEELQAEATKRRLSTAQRYLKSGHVFEVGPGNGKTLALFMQHGFEVDAVEHSATLADQVAKTTGATVYNGDFDALSLSRKYDAYMSFHVIEHVPNFVAHLKKAAEITRSGGYAFIATPHVRSLEHRVSGGLAPNFSTAHLHLFSKQGMRLALNEAGWDVVKMTTPEYPMSWLRVMTAFMRAAKGKGAAKARGGYASAASTNMLRAVRVFSIVSWPFRKCQEFLSLGEELFVVARKR